MKGETYVFISLRQESILLKSGGRRKKMWFIVKERNIQTVTNYETGDPKRRIQ